VTGQLHRIIYRVHSISGGENSGKKLRHNFAVMELQELPLKEGPKGFSTEITFSKDSSKAAAEHSVAFWVRHGESHDLLQSAGGCFKFLK